tara:strand:+ start:7761 stop:8459 length:699 start_codon:yes stop_codon:yes gene_type:complete
MANIYDVDPNKLIEKAALELKNLGLKKPIWTDFVKTGMHKERPPVDNDWWYIRLAAVLRSVYKLGPIGTSKLTRKYGGRKNRGHKPDKVFKGSGSIIRKALQQLEQSGFVIKAEKGVHKGRIATPKGRSFLDKIAGTLYQGKPKVEKVEKKEITKPTEKEIAKVEKKEITKPAEKEIAKVEKKEVEKPTDKKVEKVEKKEIIKEEKKEITKTDNKEIIEKKPNMPTKEKEEK